MKTGSKFLPTFSARRAGQGFALASAIFLLVILSALAAFIVHVSTRQHIGHAADIQGSCAYQAARAGAEWGVYNLLKNGACGASAPFAPGGNLAGFTVTVRCELAEVATTNNEVGDDGSDVPLVIRRIVATACNQPTGAAPGTCPNLAPGANYIEREIAVVAGR
ncbi:agglutinin biogenesis protein MshP [Propionivibrio limicola]|uniref:agglutinin biogenesis protein MshP n=1 Tax=Propionivibrio limicola TaxID=167645 RepID=UPI0012922FFA|nr:agglutinin biogenesis protein MshP [Propionivibrio limicola]